MSFKPKLAFLILLLLVALPLFNFLDAPPLMEWDEARLAENALEMSYNHNWIVTMHNGQPDMWNTKPPLMIWLQVLAMKVVGINELAVRLPSALAALGACLLIFFFFSKKYKEPLLGLISVIVLVTTQGYVAYHGTRTGDYDSLLTLLMAGYAIFYFLYIDEGKRKYLYATFILLILAAFTKGVQCLIFLPALFLFTVYKKKLITVLKQKDLYIGIAAFLFFVGGYYLLRERYNPGYIAAVAQNELGGRYNKVIESHVGSEWNYLGMLVNNYFHYWYALVVPGIIIGIASKKKEIKDITVYSAVLVFTYLIAISSAQTQIGWYLMPVYPFLAAITGIAIYSVYEILAGFESWKQILSFNILPVVFLFLLFIDPYRVIINDITSDNFLQVPTAELADMGHFMKNVLHHEIRIDSCYILNEDDNQSIFWYYEVLNHEHHVLKFADRANIPNEGKVILYKKDSKDFFKNKYNTQVLQTFGNVIVYKLNGKKQ